MKLFQITAQNGAPTLFLFACLFSCVPARQLEDKQKELATCKQELSDAKAFGQESASKLKDAELKVQNLEKLAFSLAQDTLVMGKSLRVMSSNYDKLNKTYELILDKNKDLLASNTTESKKMMTELQASQDKLLLERDALKLLQTQLEEKQKNLAIVEKDLSDSKIALQEREQRVQDLQRLISSKDSLVSAVRKKIGEALTAYENNGLTIEKKDGKIYVSLEERLMFASGSINVDPKGVEALKKLARVLEQNPDVKIAIEGHTDNVPYNSNSGQIADNWDLSVLRATSIVRILLKDSTLDPKRILAAGHAEFFPLDAANNAEARKKNRRTEIILTPDLDQIMKMLEPGQ